MKIVMTILRFKPAIGGGEEHVFQLSKKLADRGHDIIVYTSDLATHYTRVSYLNEETIRERNYRGVQVRRFHASNRFRRYPPLKGYFRKLMKEDCDLIHAHGFGYFTSDCSALVSAVRRIPLVLTTHGFFPVTAPTQPALDSLYVALSRNWALKISKKILSISDSDASQFKRLVDPNKITVIRNAVDTEFWSKAPSRVLHAYNEFEPKIGAVGRLTSAKGFQFLIRAAPSILKEIPTAKISIVGKDFGYLRELQRLAEEMRVSRSVSFLGELSDEALKRSEEHTSELQSPDHLVCRLLLEKKNKHTVGVVHVAGHLPPRHDDACAHPARTLFADQHEIAELDHFDGYEPVDSSLGRDTIHQV